MNERETPLSDETIEYAPPPTAAPEAAPVPPRVPFDPYLFDPYKSSRHLPWMDRSLSPSVRAARRMRPELKGFAAIEGREANGADLDEMAARISSEMVEIFRREWAADVVNEWFEEKDAAREGRPVDPSIGPKAQPIGGDPADTRPRVFVAEPGDIDWVMERLGRSSGRRQVRPRLPGARRFPPPPPPITLPESTPQQQLGGSLMTPVDPETPASPPPFPAAEPPAPIPPTPARKPLLPDFEALIPPDLKEIFRPIPGSEVIAEASEPFYIPGPSIGDPGLQVPVHIFNVRLRSRGEKSLGLSGLVDPDRVIERHPVYGDLEELAREAGRIVGPGKGGAHGSRIHHVLTQLIEADQEKNKEKSRFHEMRVEISYDPATGGETRYGTPGSMRIDIIQEYDDRVYIYELKTGGAALKEPRIDRTIDLGKFEGKSITVMELNPWRLPRK